MNKRRITQVSFIVVSMMLLSLLRSGTTIAGEPNMEQGPIATVIIEADVVTWEPQVENGGLVLTIAGPGDWYLRQEYQSGDRPTFKPADGWGKALPDGVYNYEVLLLPAKAETPAEYDESQRGLAPPENTAEARVLSGSFSILNGGFVTQDVVEESDDRGDPAQWELQDVLHYDDVIITGSLCTGFDCQDGESFGYCTEKLKENNLQFCFEDTSIGAFPTNDWKIQTNDTTGGGASYFTIWDIDGGRRPFTIEAGAPAHSLYVEDYGRVGLGSSVPYVELHIVDGDSPTIRLDQDGSSGWTAQSWDVAGNETNFFIRDVTHGSKLPFRIQPSTPSSTLCLKSNGNVGIGTWSPGYPLELETTNKDAVFAAQRTDGATAILSAGASGVQFGSSTNHNVELLVNNASVFLLDANGNVTLDGLLTEASDQALKENFRPVDGQQVLEGISQLPISTWNFISEGQEIQHMGPVAQDFYAVFGLGADDQHIAPLDANGVALAGVQELYQMVLEREAQVAQLQQQNADLESRLAQLEALVNTLVEAQSASEGK